MNLTAQEFLRDKLVHFKSNTQGVRPDWDIVAEWMNEYAILKAKHYVPLALEAASLKAKVTPVYFEDSRGPNIPIYNADKESILNSFSLDLIV